MKHLRPSRLLLAAALAAATIPAIAQSPSTPRGTYDPYSQGARAGEVRPVHAGRQRATRQDLAPTSQPSTVPAQPGMNQPDTMQQRSPDPYMEGARWDTPNLGQRLGRRNMFLDGS
ncbi:endonuclease [Cupriavidus sp. UYMMa02A]|nr:endonuclease [Cupriavidus sp. UYMMa02A]